MKKEQKKQELSVKESTPKKTAKTVVKFLRISPRKVRLVIDTIRHQPAGHAFEILAFLKQKAARMAEKALKSAVANAKVLGMDEERLIVSKVFADGGPVMKRFMARSMGRADRILKRTTHLTLEVAEGNKSWKNPVYPAVMEAAKDSSKSVKTKSGAKTKSAGAAV